MSKKYTSDLFVKNGGTESEVLMADGSTNLLPSANPSNTFLPINTNGSFTDSPFYTLPPPPLFDGFGGIGTKSTFYAVAPEGGVPNYADFGLEIQSYKDFSNQSSVSLGDYAQSIFAGEFYWYTGSSLTYDGSGSPPNELPFGVSGIAFNTSGYNLFECTYNYFKLDAKTGNPSRVDGLLFNLDAGGFGYGRGLENGIGSSEESIYWNLMTGDFTINGVYGMECFYNSPNEGKTYLSQSSYDLGLWSGAMYISDSLTLDAQPTESTKILRVRDSNGNSFQIKLYDEQN